MKRKISTFRIMLAAIFLLAITLSACGPAATAIPTESVATVPPPPPTAVPTPTEVPVLVVEKVRAAITGDESTLNPYTYVSGNPGLNILMFQYDSLFQLDAAGVPQPWLVEKNEISADGKSYTLTLRDGITWNDGEPFTSADVKFTFEYYLANTHPRWSGDVKGFESAEIVDANKIVINLAKPNPDFILTAFADMPIIPQHIWEGITDPAEHVFDVTNVGTGPYKLVEHAADQYYRFEAREDYFAGAPSVKEVVLVEFADLSSALAAFRTNEIDVIFSSVPPEQVDLLSGSEGIVVAKGPEFGSTLLLFDTQQSPFDQVAVRQAIAKAIDLQDIVDTVALGYATPGNIGWTHPSSPVFNNAVTTEYNPEEANQILDEAGFTDSDGDGIREVAGQPMKFEFMTVSDDALGLRTAELIRDMLAAIGMQADVVSVESGTFWEALWPGWDINNGRNYQMALGGWSPPVQVVASWVTRLVHSDPNFGFLNLTGFKSERMDEVLNRLIASTDATERAQIIKEIQVVIAEEVPFVTLLYSDGLYPYWSTVYDKYVFISGQGIVNKLSFLPVEAQP
jgi:peptide/nickel transport system substrate-binding protein